MARREKQPVHKVVMTEGKRNIVHQLLEEYDIQTVEDIQEALKAPDLYAQDFLFAFQCKAEDDMAASLRITLSSPHGIMDCIDVDHGIDFLQRAVLPVFNLRKYLVRHV